MMFRTIHSFIEHLEITAGIPAYFGERDLGANEYPCIIVTGAETGDYVPIDGQGQMKSHGFNVPLNVEVRVSHENAIEAWRYIDNIMSRIGQFSEGKHFVSSGISGSDEDGVFSLSFQYTMKIIIQGE